MCWVFPSHYYFHLLHNLYMLLTGFCKIIKIYHLFNIHVFTAWLKSFLVWIWCWSVSTLAAQQTPHLCHSTMLTSFCCSAYLQVSQYFGYSAYYNFLASTTHIHMTIWLRCIIAKGLWIWWLYSQISQISLIITQYIKGQVLSIIELLNI